MNNTCRKGMILRKAYVRNKTIRVPSGCIKAQSESGLKRSEMDEEMIRNRGKLYRAFRKEYGTPRCQPGQVVREGYTRKSYVRKSGVIVTSSEVRPGCIKAVGLKTKGRRLFVLERGTLSQYGYSTGKSEAERRRSLKKAVGVSKPLSVYRKLNALYVLNKNKNPVLAKLYRSDADWVKTTQEYENRG